MVCGGRTVIGCLVAVLLVSVHPGVEAIDDSDEALFAPNYTTPLQGTCSLNRVLYCYPGATCFNLPGDQSYCECPNPGQGDGLKNGTGCPGLYNCQKKEDCHPYAECTADNICLCKDGFEGNGNDCKDINECNLPSPCQDHASCRNSVGSFNCTCLPRYVLTGSLCIFKCLVNSDCNMNAVCEEQECVCRSGFMGDGKDNCTDVDECLDGNFECDENARCVNIEGSYECECKDGYSGSGKACIKLPTSCDEIYRTTNTSVSGKYEIDTDGVGPVKSINVYCQMIDNMGVTSIFPMDESVLRTPKAGGTKTVQYPADPDQIKPLIEGSTFCSQEFWLKCPTYYDLQSVVSWKDGYGNTHTGWGTHVEGQCPCGVLDVCTNKGSACNCDGNNTKKQIDVGFIIDKSMLPVVDVMFLPNSKSADWTVGPLKCGPKPIGIEKDCHAIKANLNVKLDGPELVDFDGPDSELPPVLVFCDMQSYKNLGVTVINPSGPSEVVFEETGTKPVTYATDHDQIVALIKGSVYCDQSFSYECQNGSQAFTVTAGETKKQLNYIPGGVPEIEGSCGCGVTDTCEVSGEKCNCNIDDGQTRKDFGVQIDRSDLPIVSVTAEFAGQKKGVAILGPIRCSAEQFGIEANCEKYRAVGKKESYTYLIDPDGPKTDGNDNVPPFPAFCKMLENPPMGVTVINHDHRDLVRFEAGGATGALKLALNYRYVTKPQLDALKKRCSFAKQHVKLSCSEFALHPGADDGQPNQAFYAGWRSFINNGYRFYWSGNGTHDFCVGPNGEDRCMCDSSETSGEKEIDDGDITEMEYLPVGLLDFEAAADVDSTGYVDVELGPFECYVAPTVNVTEVFKTCAVIFQKARNRVQFGDTLPEDGAFTIDPDTSGGVEPFTVNCRFPVTSLPSTPSGNTLKNTGPDPIEQCFNIDYLDGENNLLNPAQVVALVQASYGTCSQTLSLTCTNAPITEHIYFETCDGIKQTGWAGSGGMPACACGVTGTCEGGVNSKCNCDVEDGKEREDAAVIVDNSRIPICKVCIRLKGAVTDPNNSNPIRSAAFKVSNLVCSNVKLGVSTSCQQARIGNSFRESSTIYIKAQPQPIPVYCQYIAYPPAGVLQIFPTEPEIVIPPNQEIDIIILYKVFKIEYIIPLIEKFDYCRQKIELRCSDASLNLEGGFGWFGKNADAASSYWVEPIQGKPCKDNNGDCNCNLPGDQTDGGYITDQQELPLTRVKFRASSGSRTLYLGPVECYDLKKDCYDIMKSGNKRTIYWRNSTYVIDVDGAGPLDPFIVRCLFDQKNDNAVTIAYTEDKFPITITGADTTPFEIPVTYRGATPEQLNELARNSEFCMQGVLYQCKESPIGNISLADGSISPGFGLADDVESKGCPCGKLGTCGTDDMCRCDAKGPMGDFDQGVFTARPGLPVINVAYGGQDAPLAAAKATVTSLNCSRIPNGLPRTCQDVANKGFVSGEYLIYPDSSIPPFLVYCDMTIMPGKGIVVVKPATDPDTPVDNPDGSTEVTYRGVTDEQLQAIIISSSYCYQPVLVDCYKTGFIADDVFSWAGPDGVERKYWGSGSPYSQTCSCSSEDTLCGGLDGKDDMIKRKCNCEIGDAKWRKDGGVLRVRQHLPVRSFTYTTPGKNGAMANITIGDLYCGTDPIDLPVCGEFDDCAEEAVCQDRSTSSFNCICKQGYQGLINGASINDVWANGRECIDDDECSFLKCAHSADCLNLPGDFNCTCHPGYIATGKTTCRDINECEDDSMNDCDKENGRCENVEGSYECKCNRGFIGDGKHCEPQGQCTCFGDPHCLSFDARWIHFMGLCDYTMLRDKCEGTQEPDFEVSIKDWNKNIGTKAAWVQSVHVKYKTTTFELRQGREVRVNGQRRAAFAGDGIQIYDNGREVVLVAENGVTVKWDGIDAVFITVDKTFQNNTCGLCGNYNGLSGDDWVIGPGCPDSGQQTDNNNKFANSWTTSVSEAPGPMCERDCDQPPSKTDKCEMNENIADMMCRSLTDEAISVFKDCIALIDPVIIEGFYKACKIDMCYSPNTAMNNLCTLASRLAQECENVKENVPIWGNINGLRCFEECGENMVLSACGGLIDSDPGPVQTCYGNLTNTDPTPRDTCTYGCFCKDGFYRDGSKCVPKNECGCIYQNNDEYIYMKPGEVQVSDGCGSFRECSDSHVFENKTLTCHEDADCHLDRESGVYGCYCKDGFMGNGTQCEVDPCHNVNCSDNEECKAGECTCKMGYIADCNTCVDIEECKTDTHDCRKLGQMCLNLPGGFECGCQEGFFGTEGVCIDFNECESGLDLCPEHAECKNTPGGYECTCCAGFNKEGLKCLPDGTGLQNFGNKTKCCSCFGDGCSRKGMVCGTDGRTYPSEKDMIIKACKNGQYVEVGYRGACKDDCGPVLCPKPNQECKVVNGKAQCACPACSSGSANITIDAVCSSTNIMFRSECDFKKFSCGVGDFDIKIVSRGEECVNSGTGLIMNDWGTWSPCSVECGVGYQHRTRYPLVPQLDRQGNQIKEVGIAACYETCPEGPCKPELCPTNQVCVVDEAGKAECSCPDCSQRGDDHVCGRVGNIVKTYINKCELQKDACEKGLPLTLVQDYACEVLPLNCSKRFLWESRKDDNGCESIFMDWGTCEGGCGTIASMCCTPETEERDVQFKCVGQDPYQLKQNVTVSCTCQELPETSQT